MGHLDTRQIEWVLRRAKGARPKVYVETGCNAGKQLAAAAPAFTRAIGVELDPGFAAKARAHVPAALVLTEDTRTALPRLCAQLQEPVFFYLDAHFCRTDPPIAKSPFPLWDELILMRQRRFADIVVVDDVHTFGKARDDLRYGDAPEWEGVTGAAISSFLGAPGIEAGDGWIVWMPDRQ